MPDELKIQVRDGKFSGQRVVTLEGKLSLHTVPSFLSVVRAESSPALIVDFQKVTIVDSAGVGALIQTQVACTRSQRRLALSGISERVQAVLEVTRVRNLFPIFSTVEEAEAQIG